MFSIFISGCVSNVSRTVHGAKSIQEVISDPKYENITITVMGKYEETVGGDKLLIDEQGYRLILNCEEENRYFEMGKTYKAKGVLNYVEKCQCQVRYFPIEHELGEDEGWEIYNFLKMEKSKCMTPPEISKNIMGNPSFIIEYRCEPDSSEKIYYFECIEPIEKI